MSELLPGIPDSSLLPDRALPNGEERQTKNRNQQIIKKTEAFAECRWAIPNVRKYEGHKCYLYFLFDGSIGNTKPKQG